MLTLSMILSTEARFVTRASRDLVRHVRHKMDRQFGLGLTGLIHPVTKEWNHEAVIASMGGRPEDQYLGNTKDAGIHYVLGKLDGFRQPTKHLQVQAEAKWNQIAGKYFDSYDMSSFLFGWVVAMQGPTDEASDCFYASYSTIEQFKFWLDEWNTLNKTMNLFNPMFYTPMHIANNANAAYEYCNFYMYIVQLQMLTNLDFAFLSEMATRIGLVLSSQGEMVLTNMTAMFEKDLVDWYNVGFVWGMLWVMMFDIKA